MEDGGAHLLYAGAVPGGAGAPRDRGLVPGVVTTQETGLEKRDPALYRQAAARWGVPPEDCVLFEDSPGYCAAAGEAGFYVAGVRDPLCAGREEELRRLCGSWVDSLEQLPPELEARLFSGR